MKITSTKIGGNSSKGIIHLDSRESLLISRSINPETNTTESCMIWTQGDERSYAVTLSTQEMDLLTEIWLERSR